MRTTSHSGGWTPVFPYRGRNQAELIINDGCTSSVNERQECCLYENQGLSIQSSILEKTHNKICCFSGWTIGGGGGEST